MLSKLSSMVRRITNLKSFLILLVLYTVVFATFFYADVPFGLNKMRQYAGAVNILDLKFFYTAPQAYETLDLLGEQGRAIYLRILTADMIYPTVLGLFLAVTITFIFQHTLSPASRLYLLNVLPIANTLFDYCENIITLTLLKNYPSHLNAVATVNGFFTLAKNLFGLLSFSILLIGLLALAYQQFALRFLRRRK
ncbi:MAG: hypothetical protein HZB50_13935 [Chloroflexi bacterium]|nr:hypothetical protein [Chloroflexota bacterium]